MAAFADQVNNGPVPLASLDVLEFQRGEFGTAQSAADQDGDHGTVSLSPEVVTRDAFQHGGALFQGQERKFKVVKLTPIALASCERCNATFESYERLEDEAEREMKTLFDLHDCEPAVVNDVVPEQPSAFFHAVAQTKIRLIISTCCLCGRRVASSDSEVLRIAELLKIFVKNAPAGVARLDREMRYLQVSDRWCADYGVDDVSLILGRSHYEAFPDIPDWWKGVHRRALAGETLQTDEDRWEREGGTVWVHWEVRPWRGADGLIGGF